MQSSPYEEVDHTADWALAARGRDLDGLLENAAWGMLQLMGIHPAPGPGDLRDFQIQAQDAESLLVSWLEELLYEIESRGVTYTGIQVTSQDGHRLSARVREAPIAAIQRQIKGVTYHGLKIEAVPDGLAATVVFDV